MFMFTSYIQCINTNNKDMQDLCVYFLTHCSRVPESSFLGEEKKGAVKGRKGENKKTSVCPVSLSYKYTNNTILIITSYKTDKTYRTQMPVDYKHEAIYNLLT